MHIRIVSDVYPKPSLSELLTEGLRDFVGPAQKQPWPLLESGPWPRSGLDLLYLIVKLNRLQ